jgi:hypothetical protein
MINKLIEKLNNTSPLKSGAYLVEKFKGYNNHFIGIDSEKNIALLIHNLNAKNKNLTSFKGKNLEVYFDKKVEVTQERESLNSRFTVLKLVNKSKNAQWYFIKISSLLLNNLGESPEIKLVEKEIKSIKDIFSNLNKKPLKDEIGLWGELFVISIQENIDFAVKAWHVSNSNRIDFNDGSTKLEIKTTTTNLRQHNFKLSQLRNHFKENVLIGSVLTEEIDNGISILNLINKIEDKLTINLSHQFYLKLSNCLGEDLFNLDFKYFDFNFAYRNFLIFHAKDIPSIEMEHIPDQVTNVQFNSKLDETACLKSVNISQIFDFSIK